MTKNPALPAVKPAEQPNEQPNEQPDVPTTTSQPPAKRPRLTRASAAWVATGVGLLLLVMLIVFILQNTTRVEVTYLGLAGTLPLATALLIAAVAGGLIVAIVGVTRVTQLRLGARRHRRRAAAAAESSR